MGIEAQGLGPGVTEEMVIEAITQSGYPLQARAVEAALSVLRSEEPGGTRTFEEWSFVDADTGTVRQLDALVQHSITGINELPRHDPGIPTDPRALLRFSLTLLIECKQAQLPLVFFTRRALYPPPLPTIAGMPHAEIAFGPPDAEPFIMMPLKDAVSDAALPGPSPEPAIAVSRCYRKGKGLELSGGDVFKSLTTPIRKALDHYGGLASDRNPEKHLYHDIQMIVPVVVVDAPMLACEAEGNEVAIKRISEARLSLSEPVASGPGRHFDGFNRHSSLDFVHIDEFTEYCSEVLDRATRLCRRLNEAALQVITGRAFYDFDSLSNGDNAAAEPTEEKYVLNTLAPTMSPESAAQWIRNRFYELHRSDGEGDPEAE